MGRGASESCMAYRVQSVMLIRPNADAEVADAAAAAATGWRCTYVWSDNIGL
jgi:hypothetical protein